MRWKSNIDLLENHPDVEVDISKMSFALSRLLMSLTSVILEPSTIRHFMNIS